MSQLICKKTFFDQIEKIKIVILDAIENYHSGPRQKDGYPIFQSPESFAFSEIYNIISLIEISPKMFPPEVLSPTLQTNLMIALGMTHAKSFDDTNRIHDSTKKIFIERTNYLHAGMNSYDKFFLNFIEYVQLCDEEEFTHKYAMFRSLEESQKYKEWFISTKGKNLRSKIFSIMFPFS